MDSPDLPCSGTDRRLFFSEEPAMSSKQQFEIVHGFPAGADMDIHTEQAWTLWQSAWSAAIASRPASDDDCLNAQRYRQWLKFYDSKAGDYWAVDAMEASSPEQFTAAIDAAMEGGQS
jgi:hypothetical protein